MQSDSKPDLPVVKQRELRLEQRYLLVPVRTGAPKTRLTLSVDGKTVYEAEVELAEDAPDFEAPIDVTAWRGRAATLHAERLRQSSRALERIRSRGAYPAAREAGDEPLRPQFHFTARQGWLNDPNGLVYYRGVYHLFFQHNPFGVGWGNMHWGHAVSRDLIHWEERPIALAPDALGTMFSGSAVVDTENTAGLQKGKEKTLVALYTAAGGTSEWSRGQPFTQCLAYSNDGGRTWVKYAANPVLTHITGENRDPKVIWHAPSRRWIMVLYLSGSDFALFHSPDLKSWKQLQTITMPGSDECPDFFEMPVRGRPGIRKWVFTAANGRYLTGSFDGERFTPEAGPFPSDEGANFYAVQTYSDIPASDGRRIQVAWMRGGSYPAMPFSQQMSFPCELTLRDTPEGLRLYRWPVREIKNLQAREQTWQAREQTWEEVPLASGESPLQGLTGDQWDIEAEFAVGDAEEVGLRLNGEEVAWRASGHTLSCLERSTPLPIENGRVRLRALADRTSLEVFGNGGRASLSSCHAPRAKKTLGVYAKGGRATLASLKVRSLKAAAL